MTKNKLIFHIIKYSVILTGIAAAFIYLMTREPLIVSLADKYAILSRFVNSAEYIFIFTGSLAIMLLGMFIAHKRGKREAYLKFMSNADEAIKKEIDKLTRENKRLKQREVDYSETIDKLKKDIQQKRMFIKGVEAVRENYIREKAGMI